MTRSIRLLVLFNHTLTSAQEADARQGLGVSEIVTPPAEITRLWAAIPPEADTLTDYLEPVRRWLHDEARPGDQVLIQGEFGATWQMVGDALRHGLVPLYSTTRREAVEIPQADGRVVIRHCFAHVRYRRYGV